MRQQRDMSKEKHDSKSSKVKRESPFRRPPNSFIHDLSAITPHPMAASVKTGTKGKMTSTPFDVKGFDDKAKSLKIADGSYLDVSGVASGSNVKTVMPTATTATGPIATTATGTNFRKMAVVGTATAGNNVMRMDAQAFKEKLSKNKVEQGRLKEEMSKFFSISIFFIEVMK